MPGDALECCFFMLPDAQALRDVKAVSRDFCRAARRLLQSPDWMASHLTVHELLEMERLDERTRATALAWRVSRFPEDLYRVGGAQRMLPAHAAAMDQSCPYSIMSALLQVVGGGGAKGGAACRRSRGRLPIHLAAMHGSYHALAALLEAFPKGAATRDCDGCLPLHLACAGAAVAEAAQEVSAALNRDSQLGTESDAAQGDAEAGEVVAMLLAAEPSSAAEVDMAGMLALHHATVHGAPLHTVDRLLRAFPEGACHVADFGWTPLSLALVYGASSDVTLAILHAQPSCAMQRSEAFCCLPLHFAAQHKAPSRVVRALIAAYPHAVREVDAEERLPLHVAAASLSDDGALAALLQAYPLAAALEDSDGYLPLHHAVCNEAPSTVVERLINAHPAAVRKPARGSLPIHLAVAHHAPAESVRSLLRNYPDGSLCRDANGDLPLHVAAERGASAATVGALLHAHPAGARQRTRPGS